MQLRAGNSTTRTLAVLHPVFALTGVLHVVGGALLPSIALRFGLSDGESGFLFLLYFAGTSLGALLCVGSYVRSMSIGLLATAACSLGITVAPRSLLPLVFLLLGIGVGLPMSAVSLFVGRGYPNRCAAMLTFLNFTWSAGALAAPLLAAQVLRFYSYRAAYLLFAVLAAVASLACKLLLREPEGPQKINRVSGFGTLRLIAVFAIVAFLQVGIENTASAWLPTYALRMGAHGLVLAAASSAFYWAGFLSSRGVSSLFLMRTDPIRVFCSAILAAVVASTLLVVLPSIGGRNAAMFLLGVALAPIYPLVIAISLGRLRNTSDTRWVLATAGFGGSVLPWLVGWISAQSGNLRFGMLIIPGALLLMAFAIPTIQNQRSAVLD